MSAIHNNLAAGRWHTLSLAEQLGNVGSEYDRACKAKLSGDETRFNNAFDRFIELMDLTISDPRYKNYRLKELCRVREAVCDELIGNYKQKSLQNYFDHFAIATRNQ